MITNYDPNIYWVEIDAEVTLMHWEYAYKITVNVGGNVKGWDLIESAAECAADKLWEEIQNGQGYFDMVAPDGSKLTIDGSSVQSEDELMEQIVSVQFLTQKAKKS